MSKLTSPQQVSFLVKQYFHSKSSRKL